MSRLRNSQVQVIRSATRLILLSVTLSACVQAPPVFLSASDCRKLTPDEWRAGVSSAPLPADKTVGALAAFGDAQTGQLDIANGRFAAADEIQAKCEELIRKAGDAAQPKAWWHIW